MLNDPVLPLLLMVGRLCGKPLRGVLVCLPIVSGLFAEVGSDPTFAGKRPVRRC